MMSQVWPSPRGEDDEPFLPMKMVEFVWLPFHYNMPFIVACGRHPELAWIVADFMQRRFIGMYESLATL